MHHSGYILYDRYVYVKSRYIQTQTLRGHAWKVQGHTHTHTHDTRYMQNYSKLGLGQPGAGGSGSTMMQGRDGVNSTHDTCIMNSSIRELCNVFFEFTLEFTRLLFEIHEFEFTRGSILNSMNLNSPSRIISRLLVRLTIASTVRTSADESVTVGSDRLFHHHCLTFVDPYRYGTGLYCNTVPSLLCDTTFGTSRRLLH